MFQTNIPNVVSMLLALLSSSLMSIFFGRKTSGTDLPNVNYARGLVVTLYVMSWTFTTIAAILSLTNQGNIMSCTMSIFVCITLYATSKIVIYLFLIEKVYVVMSSNTPRRHNTLYRLNLALLFPYLIVFVLMVLNRIAILDEQGRCYIGLKPTASIVLILYDISISCWLTILFLRPIMSTHAALQGPSRSRLLQVARRTFAGSVISLCLSTANIMSLVYFRGYEESVLCLLSCTLDVTLNACSVHWVTSRAKGPTYSSWRNSFNNSSTNSYEKRSPTETQGSVTVRSYASSE